MIICCCDGTVDGIFSAIFKAWSLGTDNTKISCNEFDNMELFAEYVNVETEMDKAIRVRNSIIKKISSTAYDMIYCAAVSDAPDRGDAIYHFLITGYKMGAKVVDHLADPYVHRVFELNRNTGRELQHYREFIRFRKQNNVLLAKYEPHNNIITMVADHFSDRLRQENFLIVDMKRNIAAVHNAEMDYYITDVDAHLFDSLELEDEEKNLKELWEAFKESIAIESRKNLKLQQQMMPLRFRKYMDVSK